MTHRRPTVSAMDVRLMAIQALLEPPLALARIAGLSMDDLQLLVAREYFTQFRNRGLSLRQMTRPLGKSLRTLATLSKQVDGGNILHSMSRQLEAQRVVARALSRPLTRESLRKRTRKLDEDDFEVALSALIASGLIEEEGNSLVSREAHLSMVREDLEARIESLRHFLSSVTHVVYRRFYEQSAVQVAFARVLSFSARPEDLKGETEERYEQIRTWVSALDRDAEASDAEHINASLSMCIVETPSGPIW